MSLIKRRFEICFEGRGPSHCLVAGVPNESCVCESDVCNAVRKDHDEISLTRGQLIIIRL